MKFIKQLGEMNEILTLLCSKSPTGFLSDSKPKAKVITAAQRPYATQPPATYRTSFLIGPPLAHISGLLVVP